jgi:poly(3-hydroxybutyrate) depolymerase
MIEAHGLVKRYGSTMAVNDLSFSIRPGIVTGFLGPVEDVELEHRRRAVHARADGPHGHSSTRAAVIYMHGCRRPSA